MAKVFDYEELTKRIVKNKDAAGMSGAELARKVGVSPQAVSGWLIGNKYPNLDNIIALSEVFQKDIVEFFPMREVPEYQRCG